MDKVPQLGRLLNGDEERDAIHIAIAPVTAGEDLRPGEGIGFIGPAFTVGTNAKIIGIVDPFLSRPVRRGDKFYIFLIPNTITSLRHNWTHPAFEEEEKISEAEPTFNRLRGCKESEDWMKDFAEEIGSDYHEIMEGAQSYLEHGDYLVRGGTFEGVSIPEVFWDHYEKIKNIVVKEEDRGHFLSCSC